MSGTVSLLPPAEQQFCDANGAPLAGGSVSTFIPGTSTPSVTYQDSAGTIPNTNPVILDAAGRAIIWGSGSYRTVVKDVAGNLIYDQVTSPSTPTGLSSLSVSGNLTVGGATSLATLAVSGAATMDTITISQTGPAALPVVVGVTRSGGTNANANLSEITQTVVETGGTSHVESALQVKSTIDGSPLTNVWNLTARLYSTATVAAGAGATDSQHVALMGAATRNLPSGGVPTGDTMAELWSGYFPTVDATNLASSVAGAISGTETDCNANNRDDANARFGHQVDCVPWTSLANGGYVNEWGIGMGFSGHATAGEFDAFFKWVLKPAAPYSVSLFDARSSAPMDTTVKTTLGAPSTTIAVNNVWGFTSAGPDALPVGVGNPGPVTINGIAYTQTGFTIDGPGVTSGTITLSSAVSVANGTAGNKVECNARAIWLPTGAKIALSTGGDEYIFVDSGAAFNFVGASGTLLKLSAAGETLVASLNASGGIGLYGATDPGQQRVTGSRGGNAALASLITALANYGLVIDNTTA